MTPQFIDADALERHLTETAAQYEKSAPTVARYADDLYVRFRENPAAVVVTELFFVARLKEDGLWMHPNYAANALLHALDRLGRDTSGLADH